RPVRAHARDQKPVGVVFEPVAAGLLQPSRRLVSTVLSGRKRIPSSVEGARGAVAGGGAPDLQQPLTAVEDEVGGPPLRVDGAAQASALLPGVLQGPGRLGA